MSSRFRLAIYRKVAKTFLSPWMDSLRMRKDSKLLSFSEKGEASSRTRLWFHAASVGELESLIPILDSPNLDECDLRISIFSKSAESGLIRLLARLKTQSPGRSIDGGYSPAEGNWRASFEHWRPSVFVTAKYDAWPELWASAGELNVPIWIVSAKMRPAYRVAATALKSMGVELPKLRFFTVEEEDSATLKEAFPDSIVEIMGDPRWDRAFDRAGVDSPRAQELMDFGRGFPRPWWVWGQVWSEDLERLLPLAESFPGTIWAFPHDVKQLAVQELWDRQFQNSRSQVAILSTDSSSWISGNQLRPRVWVPEMGFLSEFYRGADLAFIGGGFGKGIHSLIEPAIQGIPICGGESRTDRFPEAGILERTGQFRKVATTEEIASWLEQNRGGEGRNRERWILQSRGRLGAAERISKSIESVTRS